MPTAQIPPMGGSRLHTKRRFEEVDSTAADSTDPWGAPVSFTPIAPATVAEVAELTVVPSVDPRPWKCNRVGCDKGYTTKDILNRHVQVKHIGRKPPLQPKKHKCMVCSVACTTANNLKIHMRVHTKEKTCASPTCKTVFFARESGLNLHIKIHTGEKSYECGDCPLKFISSVNLHTHWLRHHADQESDGVRVMREKTNAYDRTRRAIDETYRLIQNTRCRLAKAFRHPGFSKSFLTADLLGLPTKEVIVYLNKNDRGHTYGDPGLHNDHIRPFHDFGDGLRCPVIQREACSYLNMQLLTIDENLAKSARYTAEDAAAFKASEAGIKLAVLKLQWIADGVCPGCEYCKARAGK